MWLVLALLVLPVSPIHAGPARALAGAGGTVTVIEFYNAAQDHYFITRHAREIAT